MQSIGKKLTLVLSALLLVGCIVERPRRRVIVYGPPVAPVEVVPVAPGPDFIWVGGGYFYESDHYNWHRGYWRHR